MRKIKIATIILLLVVVSCVTFEIFKRHQNTTNAAYLNSSINVTQNECLTTNYFDDSTPSRYTSVTVKNRTDENCYFWIAREPKQNSSLKELVNNYFLERPSEKQEPFITIITDDLSYELEIGYNFIKQMRPQEEFNLILPNDKEYQKFYTDRFILIPTETVENILKQRIPPKYMSEDDVLFLTKPVN